MPREFTDTDDLSGVRFSSVSLARARFRDVDLSGAKVADALLVGADISGLIDGLKINGVEVAPLVEAELNRRHPERALVFSATTPNRVRDAWSTVAHQWDATIANARDLPDERWHARVDEEWSLAETLRHLIFVVDAWIRRPVLGESSPYHPIGVTQSGYPDPAGLGIDVDARPSIDEILATRTDQSAVVDRVVADLTEAGFMQLCSPNPAPGYPEDTAVPVAFCLGAVLNEEWHHHQYAVRDLAALDAGA